MRKVLEVIWGVRKPKYFYKGDWTASIRLIRFNKFAVTRKSEGRGKTPSPAGEVSKDGWCKAFALGD
jgi:hypothetical protein